MAFCFCETSMLDRRKKAFFVIHSFCLSQRFPTGPLGSETRFTGVRNATFEDESLYVLACTSFQKNRDLWKLASAITQKNIIEPNYSNYIANLTIAKCGHCYFYSSCGYQTVNGRWCGCKCIVTFYCLFMKRVPASNKIANLWSKPIFFSVVFSYRRLSSAISATHVAS